MFTEKEVRFIALAHKIVARRLITSDSMSSPALMHEYLFTKLAVLEHEVFLLILLDNQHRIIESVEISRGTIDQASVYPREVVKTALQPSDNGIHGRVPNRLCLAERGNARPYQDRPYLW